jgi:F-type H+-transporting ATPase subunit b
MKPFRRVLPLATALMALPFAAMAEGMPQMDFKNPLLLSQVWWGMAIFAVLYIVASRVALPKVGEVLEERASKIAADLEAAQASKTKADADAAESMAAIAKARSEAQAAINAALETAKAAAATQAAALNERIEKQLGDAETQIAQARAAALGALREVATDTANTVVTRLTGRAPDTGRLSQAVGFALAARGVA